MLRITSSFQKPPLRARAAVRCERHAGGSSFLLKRDIDPASNDNSPMWLRLRLEGPGIPGRGIRIYGTKKRSSRSLQSICKDMDFMIRFRREASDGGDHGCQGDFGKEVCCAAER